MSNLTVDTNAYLQYVDLGRTIDKPKGVQWVLTRM